MQLRQGNVFTPVCHSVHGGCLPQYMLGDPLCPCMHTPTQCILGYTPPCPVHARIHMATAADGMHPTGMHSFSSNWWKVSSFGENQIVYKDLADRYLPYSREPGLTTQFFVCNFTDLMFIFCVLLMAYKSLSSCQERNATCFCVRCGRLNSNQSKECGCVMEFSLIYVNVLIAMPFGICWGKYLETYLSINCRGCYYQFRLSKITSEVSANKFPDKHFPIQVNGCHNCMKKFLLSRMGSFLSPLLWNICVWFVQFMLLLCKITLCNKSM